MRTERLCRGMGFSFADGDIRLELVSALVSPLFILYLSYFEYFINHSVQKDTGDTKKPVALPLAQNLICLHGGPDRPSAKRHYG